MEQVVKVLAGGLDPVRFVVEVFCLLDEGPLAAPLRARGISVRTIPNGLRVLSTLWPSHIARALAPFRPDVVHSHSGCWFSAVVAARRIGVPISIHTDHGRFAPDKRGIIWMDRLSWRWTDRLVCVSDELSKYMNRVVGVPANRIVTIRNGIPVGRSLSREHAMPRRLRSVFGVPEDAWLLVSVGRLTEVKGHRYLIEAVEILRQRGREVCLWILGEGTLREELEKQVAKAGLDRQVFLVGSVQNVNDYLFESDAFVLPSLSEGTSMALLEAMGIGLPSIATDVGGNHSVLEDGEAGLLVQVGSAEAIAAAVVEMLDDRSLGARMGTRASEIVIQSYSASAMVGRYQELYTTLLSQKGIQ